MCRFCCCWGGGGEVIGGSADRPVRPRRREFRSCPTSSAAGTAAATTSSAVAASRSSGGSRSGCCSCWRMARVSASARLSSSSSLLSLRLVSLELRRDSEVFLLRCLAADDAATAAAGMPEGAKGTSCTRSIGTAGKRAAESFPMPVAVLADPGRCFECRSFSNASSWSTGKRPCIRCELSLRKEARCGLPPAAAAASTPSGATAKASAKAGAIMACCGDAADVAPDADAESTWDDGKRSALFLPLPLSNDAFTTGDRSGLLTPVPRRVEGCWSKSGVESARAWCCCCCCPV